jgi:predicted DsbA family dithiol-disulfide isomerase
MDSHRLIAYAEDFGHEKQEALVEELFSLYLTQEQWLSKDVLVEAAQKVGIPGAKGFLEDENAGLGKVYEHLEEAKELEIASGEAFTVPSFIIGGAIVKGSQTQEEYEELILAALDSTGSKTE